MKIERIQTPELYQLAGSRVDRRYLKDGIEVSTDRAVAPDLERHKNREYPSPKKDPDEKLNADVDSHGSELSSGEQELPEARHIDLVV